MAISVTADPIDISLFVIAVRSTWPPAERDATKDLPFDCLYEYSGEEKSEPDALNIYVRVLGNWLNVTITADPIDIAVTPQGTLVEGFGVSADFIPIEVSFGTGLSEPEIILTFPKNNWVKWSNIGSLDFTIGSSNVAGERPVDWQGQIHEVKKLRSGVVAYGENGVSVLNPSGKYYGLTTIHRIGLQNRGLVAGNDSTHFFINNKGELYSLGEELEKLDYSEYLSSMTDPVMSYDPENEVLYICDNVSGYVYSIRDNSLGTCSPNITGANAKDGTLYIAASGAIVTPVFEICTDIYDLGTRKLKTVYSIELGTDLSGELQASIDYRMDKSQAFVQTNWYKVDNAGVARITCNGREFRFRAKALAYEAFELDYLTINGEVLSH